MGLKVAFASALALVTITGAAHANSTIDTLPSWNGSSFISSFGGSNGGTGVYGETFTAPGGPLHSYTFEVNDQGVRMNDIVAEVFAWSGNLEGGNPSQGATGPALFTSAPFTITGENGFQAVTVYTGNLTLTTGDNYVILFADTGTDAAFAHFGLVGNGLAAGDGGFNYFNNNHTLGDISGTWDDGVNFGSLAYDATFGVPEPAAWALMILGVGAVGVAARRRRKGSAIAA